MSKMKEYAFKIDHFSTYCYIEECPYVLRVKRERKDLLKKRRFLLLSIEKEEVFYWWNDISYYLRLF